MLPTVFRGGLPLAAGILAIALAACASGASSTPLPSGAEPPGNCAKVQDGVIEFSAENLEFSAPCMVATAGEAFTIHFTNKDTQPHNVAVYNDSSKSTEIMAGDIISTQNEAMDYAVEAQDAGQYYFDCSVHTQMSGTLYVVSD